jgi:ubiquinone/menaquinone biosynthesis C-methylase UbiE
MSGKPDVDTAYALESVEDVRALYRDWAETYDTDFIEAMGYIYPREVARVFVERRTTRDAPILDIGCGSGAVAEAVTDAAGEIDGLDLSPDMLAVARSKGIYRDCIEGDLLKRLPIRDESYGALLSAGTFTHGHVGPEALPEIMRIARPRALFCLGINGAHFEAHGFGDAFARLADTGAITPPHYVDCPVYTEKNHGHASVRALVAVFRKC